MITVKFEGGAELAAALRDLSTRLQKSVLRECLKEGGEPMRQSIASKAPREPGAPDLADNIVIATVRDQDNLASVGIGPGKYGESRRYFFYDTMQEFGTVHSAAQPFYRPGMDETWPKTLKIVGDAMWRELAGRGIHRPTVTVDVPVQDEV